MRQLQVGALSLGLLAVATGCTTEDSGLPGPGPACTPSANLTAAAGTGDPLHRAYVASRDSGNITVIDLDTLSVVSSLDTCRTGYHMMELSADFKTGFASDTAGAKIDVIDLATFDVTASVDVEEEPTHLSASKDGTLLAVVEEGSDSVAFIDPSKNTTIKQLPGFQRPHFVRWAPDGRYAYVANLHSYNVTRVDLTSLTIDDRIAMDGHEGEAAVYPTVDDEGGFADVQIDNDGIAWAAHRETGKTLIYDTNKLEKLPERSAGAHPWIVYAEHPFTEVRSHTVPSWGDRAVTVFEPKGLDTVAVATEESESYGVNYSPRAPEKAFVMNRRREEIAVVNTATKQRDAVIAVGGTTETASTTADGRYIVAAVSSANSVVVIDAETNAIVKTFENVGKYPWTVSIPLGQNYCH